MEYQEIINRKKQIVESPLKAIPEDVSIEIRKEYAQRCQQTIRSFERAKKIIPGGLEHNLSIVEPYPLTMKTAVGATIQDIDGNSYVDYLMGGGPIILGHKFKEVEDAIVSLIQDYGPSTGLTCESEILCAEEIARHMPGVEMVRFQASGTEADMLAIRIARAFTGKKKIVKIGGSYHGWSDQVLLSTDYPGKGNTPATGVPEESYMHTIEVMPNDFEGLARIFEENKSKGGIAAVLAEPTGGHAGTFPNHPDWNKALRKICDENGALLVFDEVVTGFRLSMGGGQEYFGVVPDITVLGKIITHGYPSCGAVAGSREIMSICHPSTYKGRKAYTGGTLTANPISTTAGYLSIKCIEKYNAIEKASAYGDKLTNELNDLFSTRSDLPFFAYNFGSIVHVETTCPSGVYMRELDQTERAKEENLRSKAALETYLALLNQGVLILGDFKRMYVCMQHDEEALEKTLKAWKYVVDLIPVNC